MTNRDTEIEAFEKKIGRTLPDDYRRFLLSGPFPIWDKFGAPRNDATRMLFELHDLGRDDYTDIARIWDERNEYVPEWFLEIAEVSDGVKLGVGLEGRHEGRMYWFTYDDGEAKPMDKTFSEFLQELYDAGGSFDDTDEDGE